MASRLQFDSPDLWKYWTRGEGLKRWYPKPHPFTALVLALRKEGVPEHQVHGLAAKIMHAVTGKYPGQRKKGERL